jgi:AcrR family transcriptional regulator
MDNKPRKQPKQKRAQERVDSILDCSINIIESEGIEKLNTNYIAEKSGISVGSIYQYFPNKESIVSNLIERHYEERIKILNERIFTLRKQSVEMVVEGIIRTLFESHKKHPNLEQIFQQKKRSLGGYIREQELDQRLIKLLEKYMKRTDAHFDVKNFRLALNILGTTFKAVCLDSMYDDRFGSEEEVIQELKKLSLRYILRRPYVS